MAQTVPNIKIKCEESGLTVSVTDEGPIIRLEVEGQGAVEFIWNDRTRAMIEAAVEADRKMAEID